MKLILIIHYRFIKKFTDNYIKDKNREQKGTWNGSENLIKKLDEDPELIKAFDQDHGTIFIQIFQKSVETSFFTQRYRKVLKNVLEWSTRPTYESDNVTPKRNGKVEEKLFNIKHIINEQDGRARMTALHYALKRKWPQAVIQMLINDLGAKVTIEDRDGEMALDMLDSTFIGDMLNG